MVEKDPATGKHPVCLTVIHGNPVTVNLGGTVRRARIERGRLALRNLLDLTEHFRRRGLIETGLLFQSQNTDGLENAQRPQRVRVRGVLRRFKRDTDVTLGREVIDLIRLYLLHDPNEIRGISQVTVVQVQPHALLMRILVQVIDTVGVEGRGAPLDAVDFVPLTEKELRQISTVLSGNASNQSFFSHKLYFDAPLGGDHMQ